MSSNENDALKPAANNGDPLEALLRDARYTAPAGLAARLAARALDPEQGKILFWADVERVSRTLIGKVAVAAVLAAGLALGVAYNSNSDDYTAFNQSGPADSSDSNSNDSDVLRFVTSPITMDSIVGDSSASGVGGTSGESEEH